MSRSSSSRVKSCRPLIETALIGSIFGFSITGCSGHRPESNQRATRSAPVAGTVDLAVLERMNPQRVYLAQIDQAIRAARTESLPLVRTNPALASDGPAQPVRLGTSPMRTVQIAAVQQERLSALQAEILANLDTRLTRADNQRLASIRSRLNAAIQQTYLSQVNAIDDAADARINLVTEQNRDVAVNLLTKIQALTADLDPPPTAPSGYWKDKLSQRQRELNELEQGRRTLIAAIREGRDQSRSALMTQLVTDAQDSFAQAVAAAETRRQVIVAAARARLTQQTRDILASSKTLDAEAGALSVSTGKVAQTKLPFDPTGMFFAAGPRGDDRQDLELLLEQRRRIQEQIDRETLSTVKDVARLRNVDIIGYKHEQGVTDITDHMVKWVQSDRWGVS